MLLFGCLDAPTLSKFIEFIIEKSNTNMFCIAKNYQVKYIVLKLSNVAIILNIVNCSRIVY